MEADFYYLCTPANDILPALPVEFLTVQAFLADEPACQALWELLVTQFRTRSKFLSIWPCVRYVAVHRNSHHEADGFLLVSAPVNWQIDYVVVDPESRGQGIAAALVKATIQSAFAQSVPYVMLTSKASLRPLYEGCGFVVVGSCPIT